jgi:hypothetical protein
MSEFFGEPYEFEDRGVLKLAQQLECAISQYDEDYREGLSDCFSIKKCSVDRGANIENKVELSVVKLRGVNDDGDLIDKVEYSVTAEVIHFNLTIDSFPEDLWEQLRDEGLVETEDFDGDDDEPEYTYDEDWLDILNDEETDFSISYRYSHMVNSDGQLFPQSCIVVNINEHEILLPEHRAEMRPSSALSTSTENDPPTGQGTTVELFAVFTLDELKEFQSLGAMVLAEYRPTKIIENLYDFIDGVRYRTTEMRVNAMRQIVSNLLPELQLADKNNE